jgi:hypothetical protein
MFVIPAEAGIQRFFSPLFSQRQIWIPVSTGMTSEKTFSLRHLTFILNLALPLG